ncbi:MAG: hypothetical protein JWN91_3667 [Nocardioides sp.]|jgi:hypothetical protein|nr:hypothetical protein [Nocardioides sp.]
MDPAIRLVAVGWDSSSSAERERLAALSDDDSAAIQSIDANPRIVRKSIAWMADRQLARALPGTDD